MLLKGSKVLITGATGGIGKEICKLFLNNGCELFFTGSDEKSLKILKDEFLKSNKNSNIHCFPCNLLNKQEILSLVEQANNQMHGIDILICNAGITDDSLMLKMSYEKWQNVIDINLTANFILARECIKIMLKQKFGKIINIASIVGMSGNVGQANYSASKAGLIAMTKCIAQEYAGKNITANCIAPGFIDTKMTQKIPETEKQILLQKIPMKKYGKPEDIANACLFLASHMSDYITGETLCVNGGMLMK